MTVAAAWSTGTFQLPAGGGRASFISRAELSEAIAAAALAPALARTVYELTGQATHDYQEVAAAVGKVTRQPRAISSRSARTRTHSRWRAAASKPTWSARWPACTSAVAAGKFDRVRNDFALLVGHPPRPLACLAQELFGKH